MVAGGGQAHSATKRTGSAGVVIRVEFGGAGVDAGVGMEEFGGEAAETIRTGGAVLAVG